MDKDQTKNEQSNQESSKGVQPIQTSSDSGLKTVEPVAESELTKNFRERNYNRKRAERQSASKSSEKKCTIT